MGLKTSSKGNVKLTAVVHFPLFSLTFQVKKKSTNNSLKGSAGTHRKTLKIQLNCIIMTELIEGLFCFSRKNTLGGKKTLKYQKYQNVFLLIKFRALKLLWNRSVEKPLNMFTVFFHSENPGTLGIKLESQTWKEPWDLYGIHPSYF